MRGRTRLLEFSLEADIAARQALFGCITHRKQAEACPPAVERIICMFSSSIHFLTCVAMIAHSVLGCCWHHAHASSWHGEHRVTSAAMPAHHHSQPCAHHSCGHAHADRASEHGHPPASGDGTLHPCCGEEGQHVPCECCLEAECTYLPSASPVLTGPVDMPFSVSAEGVSALSAAASLQCGSGFDGGGLSTIGAERCALLQVWRL